MCLTKNGESGKDCKGVLAQKDKRGETCDYLVTQCQLRLCVQNMLLCTIIMQHFKSA